MNGPFEAAEPVEAPAPQSGVGLDTICDGVRWYPAAWLAGLGGVFVPGVAAWALLRQLNAANKPARLSFECVVLAVFVAIYFVAILGAAASGEHAIGRILASTYNWTLWLSGLCILLVLADALSREAAVDQVCRQLRETGTLVALAGALLIAAWWFLGVREVRVPSLLGWIHPTVMTSGMPLVRAMTNPPLIVTDWIFGVPLPRLTILHPYPNALAISALVAATAHVYLTVGDNRGQSGTRRWWWLGLLMIPLIFTWQRTILLVLALTLVVTVLLHLGSLQQRILVRSAAALILLGSAPEVVPRLRDLATTVQEARAGSSTSRAAAYRQAWEYIEESPVTGLGVKVRDDDSPLSIGSHSTYVGALMKTGLFGALIILIFAIAIGLRSTRLFLAGPRRLAPFAVAGLTTLAWIVVEDLDAPALASMHIFILFGLVIHATSHRAPINGS